MSAMTDPTNAMVSIEEEIKAGRLKLDRCHFDREMGAYGDQVEGMTRLAYVRFDDQGVAAFVNMFQADPVEGVPCFQAGVAVPPRNRRKGMAKSLFEAAIKEMAFGYGRTPLREFYVEAIVGQENVASNAVCRSVLSDKPEAVTDNVSGEPAFQYLRKVETIRA